MAFHTSVSVYTCNEVLTRFNARNVLLHMTLNGFPSIFNYVDVWRLCWPTDTRNAIFCFSTDELAKTDVLERYHLERTTTSHRNICTPLAINSRPISQYTSVNQYVHQQAIISPRRSTICSPRTLQISCDFCLRRHIAAAELLSPFSRHKLCYPDQLQPAFRRKT